MDSHKLDERFVVAKRVIVVIDLSNFTKAFIQCGDAEIATFLDLYYSLCERTMADAGGSIVKFMGDGCLAVFPVELASAAVSAVIELQRAVEELAAAHGHPFML